MSYPTDLQHVALYLRKSRSDVEAEAHGEGETLSKHRRALMNVAVQYRYTIDDVYEEIVSGERILERPHMQALLTAVQSKRYDAVLCMDVDRLGRGNQIDQGLIHEAFKESQTLIITPRKVYNLQDELDEEWSEFEAFMARRELKIITRRLQRGRRQSAAEGKSISKKPPFGYLRGADLKLVPDPETAPTVRLVFRLSAEGRGMTSVANYLTDHGYKTPDGRYGWERSSVYAILKNPAYLGHIVWGRTRYQKAHGSSGYQISRTPPEQWIVHENAHPPLVDQETYDRYLVRARQASKVSNTRQLSNPLASLLYCEKCGHAMRRQQTYGKPYNNLLCITHKCATRGARFEIVEQRIVDALRHLLRGFVADPQMRRPPQADVKFADDLEQRIARLETDIAEATDQQARLHDLVERGVYDVDLFMQRNHVLTRRLDDLRKHRTLAVGELERAKQHQERHVNAPPTLVRVMSVYAFATTAQAKNDLLKSIIERIVYRREPDWTETDHFAVEIFLRV